MNLKRFNQAIVEFFEWLATLSMEERAQKWEPLVLKRSPSNHPADTEVRSHGRDRFSQY